jgi:hypothetical protein
VATLIRDISDEDAKRKDWARASCKTHEAGIASVANLELDLDLLDTSLSVWKELENLLRQ